MEYTDIRYSDIPTCIDSVSARAAQLEERMSPNELCEGEQSHAYIIKHPISTQWLLVMEYTHIRYSDILTCIDLWVPEQHKLEDGWSPNELCEGEQSHAYIISTQSQHNWLLVMEYTHIRYSEHYYVYWFCEWPEQHNWGTDGLQMNCWGKQSHAYIIKHPNLNTIDSLWWNTLTSGKTKSDITTCIDSVSARAAQLGDGCLQWIVGRAVSCLHNQAPNLNHNWLLVME